MENCTGLPGLIYQFDSQNLVTFEDNLKYKSDMLVVAYINFETTTPTDSCLDPEKKCLQFLMQLFLLFILTLKT